MRKDLFANFEKLSANTVVNLKTGEIQNYDQVIVKNKPPSHFIQINSSSKTVINLQTGETENYDQVMAKNKALPQHYVENRNINDFFNYLREEIKKVCVINEATPIVEKIKTPRCFEDTFSGAIFCDPVVGLDGHTYERVMIKDYLKKGKNKNYLFGYNKKMKLADFQENKLLKLLIKSFMKKYKISEKEQVDPDEIKKIKAIRTKWRLGAQLSRAIIVAAAAIPPGWVMSKIVRSNILGETTAADLANCITLWCDDVEMHEKYLNRHQADFNDIESKIFDCQLGVVGVASLIFCVFCALREKFPNASGIRSVLLTSLVQSAIFALSLLPLPTSYVSEGNGCHLNVFSAIMLNCLDNNGTLYCGKMEWDATQAQINTAEDCFLQMKDSPWNLNSVSLCVFLMGIILASNLAVKMITYYLPKGQDQAEKEIARRFDIEQPKEDPSVEETQEESDEDRENETLSLSY